MMGTIRYVTHPGRACDGLFDHEGFVVQVLADGSERRCGGVFLPAADEQAVAWRATCHCGWRGDVVVERQDGESAQRDFIDLPALGDEWRRHALPHLAELAGHRTTVRYDDSLGSRGWAPHCRDCDWESDEPYPTKEGAQSGERGHQEDVTAQATEWKQ